MKSAAVSLQCSDAGAPEVVQHLYQIFFRALSLFSFFSFFLAFMLMIHCCSYPLLDSLPPLLSGGPSGMVSGLPHGIAPSRVQFSFCLNFFSNHSYKFRSVVLIFIGSYLWNPFLPDFIRFFFLIMLRVD